MRSMTIKDCMPLLGIRDIDWYSLQVDRPNDKLPKHVVPLAVGFLETAGAILSLDLVVSVDTAVAHIAGALGRPVWLFLPTVADWRYHSAADSTPWYPSMRLFRQTQRGDWRSPVTRISAELKHLIESRATG